MINIPVALNNLKELPKINEGHSVNQPKSVELGKTRIFDACVQLHQCPLLREGLTYDEADILCLLVIGHEERTIAYLMSTTVQEVLELASSAQKKLRAATRVEAMATASIIGCHS